MKLTDWLIKNEYSFLACPSDNSLIQLEGEWMSQHQHDVFATDAEIWAVPNADPEVSAAHKITDHNGAYRLEEYKGNGSNANGMIAEWAEWVDSHDLSQLTYAQAVALVGAETVKAVDAEQADYGVGVRDDGLVEFTASVQCPPPSDYYNLTVHYYQTQEHLDACADGDLGSLAWTVDHYGLS